MSQHTRLHTTDGDDLGNISHAMARRMRREGLAANVGGKLTLISPRKIEAAPVERTETSWHPIEHSGKHETAHCVLHLHLESVTKTYPGARPIPIGKGHNFPGQLLGGTGRSGYQVELTDRRAGAFHTLTGIPLLVWSDGPTPEIEQISPAEFLHKFLDPLVREQLDRTAQSNMLDFYDSPQSRGTNAPPAPSLLPEDWGWLALRQATETREVYSIPWLVWHRDGISYISPLVPGGDRQQVLLTDWWFKDASGIEAHGALLR
jgi:hypothetical protein